jgi:hypothetical protein
MANRRIYYAIQAVGIAPNGTNTFTSVHGLQSVGINTRFNLEQVFEIGQLSIYQNVENLPDIETTMEKVLDGYPLLYHLSTYGAPDASLVGRSNQRASVALSIFNDNQQSASGTPIQQCTCSGMYLSSVTFDLKVEGASTESITMVGNNKIWLTAASGHTMTYTGGFNNNDAPLAPEGCNYRQNVVMANCRFPKNIPGINTSGVNTVQADGSYAVHFQSIRVTANLGREQLLELGHKAPYFRYINFPVEIRIDFEIINTMGDNISATEEGVYGNGNNVGAGDYIFVEMQEGLKIDCGTKAVLSSVNYGGANAGARGGNAATTYSYTTFNDLIVTHPQDPSPGLAA